MLVSHSLVIAVLLCAAVCQAFIGSGDDAYMKKYAIRKVWESCFGSDVVKQIRIEKRAAIAKCRSYSSPTPTSLTPGQNKSPTGEDPTGVSMEGPEPRPETHQHPMHSHLKDIFPPKKRPSAFGGVHSALAAEQVQHGVQHSVQHSGVQHGGVQHGVQHSAVQHGVQHGGVQHAGVQHGGVQQHGAQHGNAQQQVPNYDTAKLQALFAYKNQQNGYQQTQPQPSSHQYNPFLGMNPFPSPQYQATQAYPQAIGAYPPYSGISPFAGGGLSSSYPGVQQYPMFPQQNGFYAAQQSSPYYQPQYQPQAASYYGNARQRPARNLNMQTQIDLEALHRAIGAKAENVSCQLQELGYLDENLDPAYEKIAERVKLLPVEDELKGDMLDGLEFCKRFSQCMPDMRKDAARFSKDQDRQMFFFSCYKHKKLEACLMKDVRERFMTDDPLTQEDLNADDLRSLPRGRKAKMPDFKSLPTTAQQFDDMFVRDDDIYFV